MDERAYKKIKSAGACSLTFGILTLVFGLTAGVMLVVSGAKLLAHKSETLF